MIATLTNILVTALMLIGGVFCLLAAVGILVMPDVYTRMQAASKSVTLGACSIILVPVLLMSGIDVMIRGLLVCLFLVVTIPAASHLVARAAYRSKEPLAPETELDELENCPIMDPVSRPTSGPSARYTTKSSPEN